MDNQKVHKKPANFTIVHIVIILLFGCFTIVSFVYSVEAANNYKTYSHGNFVLEEATIVSYDDNTDTGKLVHYYTLYEYEADGLIYYGCWERLIKDEEYAKAQVGKKVPIYVDHNLRVHLKTLDFEIIKRSAWIYGAICLISFGVFANSAIRLIIKFVRYQKKKKEIKNSEIGRGEK